MQSFTSPTRTATPQRVRRQDLLGIGLVLVVALATVGVLAGRAQAAPPPAQPTADQWYELDGSTIRPLLTDDLVAAKTGGASEKDLVLRNDDGSLAERVPGTSNTAYLAADGVGIWDSDYSRWVRNGSTVTRDVQAERANNPAQAAAGDGGQLAVVYSADTGARGPTWYTFGATTGTSPDWSPSGFDLGIPANDDVQLAFANEEGLAIIAWQPEGTAFWQSELLTLRRDADGDWVEADRQLVPRVSELLFDDGQLYLQNGVGSPHLRWYRYLGGVYPCDCSGPAPFYEIVDEIPIDDLGESAAGNANDGARLLAVDDGRLVVKLFFDFNNDEIQLINAVDRKLEQTDPFVVWSGCPNCASIEGAALDGPNLFVTTTSAALSRGTLQRFDRGTPPGAPDPRPNPPTPVDPPSEPVPDGCTIIGTAGDDVLEGTPGNDVICGLGGNDTIRGGDGDDWLHGGSGDDIIRGGDGLDWITGDAGADDVEAGNGSDRIYGGDGDDVLRGGDGFDTIQGGAGNDLLTGWRGTDRLHGGLGDDTLYGGQGNDYVEGDHGADVLDGGDGWDEVVGGPGNDTVRGGPGNDTLSGGYGNDTIYGGRGNDTLEGGVGNDLLLGEQGTDTLLGEDGDDEAWGGPDRDVVDGGEGNDVLGGGPGFDSVFGRPGNDTLYAGPDGAFLDGGGGTDTCRDITTRKSSCER